MTRIAVLTAAFVLGLAVPAVAAPGVSTGGVANVGQSTATLNGAVNSRGVQTSSFFQYGTSMKYAAETPSRSAGNGKARVDVTVRSSASPNTLYHYRLVAVGGGTANGSDRTFRTARVANSVTLGATPEPATFGGSAAGGARVVLHGRLFPYTSAFAPIGNPVLAAGDGRLAFTVAPLVASSQFQAVSQPGDAPRAVASPVVGVRARVRVSLGLSASSIRRGRGVNFGGTVRPSRVGSGISIQRRGRDGAFHTIVRTTLRSGTADYSRFISRTIHPTRSGDYRMSFVVDGAVYNGTSPTRHVAVHSR